jgi:hypothetical protein
MKNLNVLALALACSVGSVAVAKNSKSNMISVKGAGQFERAVAYVTFVPTQRGHQTHDGYVELKNGKGDLAKATHDTCNFNPNGRMQEGSCGDTVLKAHFNNEARNVDIFVRKIMVGKFDNAYQFRPGSGSSKHPRGAFVTTREPHGTMARNFEIVGNKIKIAQ